MIIIYLYFFILSLLEFGNCITINAVAFTYDIATEIYTLLRDEFNKYSIENDLGIHLD